MTEQREYTLDGEPLSVCATNALLTRLATADAGWRHAIIAELGTRTGAGWEPYGGMCVP
jgi:hypothetical protein